MQMMIVLPSIDRVGLLQHRLANEHLSYPMDK